MIAINHRDSFNVTIHLHIKREVDKHFHTATKQNVAETGNLCC